MTVKKSYLFRDKLKTPGYLSQFDVARIRKITEEATEREFEEYMSCSVEGAKRILSFWEIAQIELWDVKIIERFFHEWIYADRELVTARIQASIVAGRLPERFAPEVGLKWLESENVLIGMMGHWVRANARRRDATPRALVSATPDSQERGHANPVESRQNERLSALRQLGGSVTKKNGGLSIKGITALVSREAARGASAKTEKTIRADLKAAYGREADANRAGAFFAAIASR